MDLKAPLQFRLASPENWQSLEAWVIASAFKNLQYVIIHN